MTQQRSMASYNGMERSPTTSTDEEEQRKLASLGYSQVGGGEEVSRRGPCNHCDVMRESVASSMGQACSKLEAGHFWPRLSK